MNAAHAVLIEVYRSFGDSIQTALDKTARWQEGGAPEDRPTVDVPAVSEDSLAKQNTQAFQELMGMMKGVKK